MRKIDIVLQGPIYDFTHDIAEKYSEISFINQVIVSTWNEFKHKDLSTDKIKYYFSEPPSFAGLGNRNMQIKSSLEGLKKVSTEFCCRGRTDQIYDVQSMNVMHDFYENHKTKVLTYENNNIFPYNRICVAGIYENLAFHPRDHFFWGNTKDLIEFFDIPYDNLNGNYHDKNMNVRSECYIASYYYAKFESRIYDFINQRSLYLTDSSPYRDEVMKIYQRLMTKVLKPFPRNNVDFEFVKYGMKSYHYDEQKLAGQIWAEDDIYCW